LGKKINPLLKLKSGNYKKRFFLKQSKIIKQVVVGPGVENEMFLIKQT